MAFTCTLARLPMLLLLGSVFLPMVVSGHNALWEHEKSQQQNPNPYLFRSQNFQTRFENQRGRIRILPRFDQRHDHFRGLQNYRLVELELQPHSLFLPHHRDAENVLVALEGKAIVTIVNQTNKETYNLEQGDMLRVRPGCLVYAANVEQNQKFRATSILIPVNIPGEYENLYPSGNKDPWSYFLAFSETTLEATFNSKYNEIQRVLFGQKQQGEKGEGQRSNEGVMVKLSMEQAREMRRLAESSSSSWSSSSPRRRSPSSSTSSSRTIFNLRNLQPRYSNNYGKLWEARPEDFPELLRDLDVSVAFLELIKGSLFLPHYNSKAILICQISDGGAELEIASPHLANERSQQQGQENKHHEQQKQQEKQEDQSEGQIIRVASRLNQGDVFVALAGHPLALRASKNNDLRMVAFLLDAENNQRNFLGGGKDNVMNQIDRIVMEQAFNGSGEEVEELLNNQKESYFVNVQSSRGEDRPPMLSILEEDSF